MKSAEAEVISLQLIICRMKMRWKITQILYELKDFVHFQAKKAIKVVLSGCNSPTAANQKSAKEFLLL